MPLRAICLDDGGVMNDNRLRAPQWRRLVGEFFAPRLGGEPDAWAAANGVVAARLFEPANWQARVRDVSGYADFERSYYRDWLGGMCDLVGVPLPGEAATFDLARRAEAYITPLVHAAFPGAVEAIRSLHARGYVLHTASGGSSLHLAGYLEGMGVRDCFGSLYGADLLDVLKESPTYYERLFADCGIDPAEALIVDDSPRALAWAAALGARTALVSPSDDGSPTPDVTYRIARLADLPGLLMRET